MLSGTRKSKKAVSVIIGYVLLVSFIIIISGITYTWLKTYLPSQSLECQEGVSVFVKKSVFNSSTSELKVTLKNTGRFNIGGYFIHAKNDSSQELAVIDLSKYLNDSFRGTLAGNSIVFSTGIGELKSGEEEIHIFNIPSELGDLSSVTVTPVRFQEFNNRERFVSCGDARTEQVVGEDIGACVPDEISLTCGSRVCGSVLNNCNALVSCPPDNCEDSGLVCEGTGQCVPAAACTDTCSSLGYVCGTWNICGVSTVCGTCTEGETCDVAGQCVSNINNGVCDPGETCANEPACEGQQANCVSGQICQGGSCAFQGGTYNEDDYCRDLGLGYSGGDCVANNGQCISQPGGINENDEPGASTYCPGQVLCCTLETRIVFISSSTHDGTIGAGGLSGADAVCAGDTAGIPGTFVAWLSTDTVDAKDRINDGAYYLYDGTTKVADNKADLLDGTLDHVIDRDASGNFISGGDVWTGTNSDGTKATSNCNNWGSLSGSDKGWTGDSSSTSAWTNKGGENSCSNPQRIYCFRVAN